MGALDAADDGEPSGGGAARFRSPEHGGRRTPAAALGGARRDGDTGTEGEGKVVLEDRLLTTEMMKRSERAEKLGNDGIKLGNWQPEAVKIGSIRAAPCIPARTGCGEGRGQQGGADGVVGLVRGDVERRRFVAAARSGMAVRVRRATSKQGEGEGEREGGKRVRRERDGDVSPRYLSSQGEGSRRWHGRR